MLSHKISVYLYKNKTQNLVKQFSGEVVPVYTLAKMCESSSWFWSNPGIGICFHTDILVRRLWYLFLFLICFSVISNHYVFIGHFNTPLLWSACSNLLTILNWGGLYFFSLIYRTSLYTLDISLCWIYILQISSASLWLAFLFCHVLWWSEVFNFNTSTLSFFLVVSHFCAWFQEFLPNLRSWSYSLCKQL